MSCDNFIGPGQYQTCSRPERHRGSCELFSLDTRLETMVFIMLGRKHPWERAIDAELAKQLDEMAGDFWRREAL